MSFPWAESACGRQAGSQWDPECPGYGYFEDLFQNRTDGRTEFWESCLLCFTRVATAPPSCSSGDDSGGGEGGGDTISDATSTQVEEDENFGNWRAGTSI